MSQLPLTGLVVADFTSMVAGASTTRLLADCGATVIKIEAIDGDVLRNAAPQQDGISLLYGLYNAGKQSIALDLKTEAGLAIARRIIAKADILVENFRPGAMERLGLDYATISSAHPQIVYCSISGFGQSGPLAQRAAYAPVAHAFSGFDMLMSRIDDPEAPPVDNRVMTADVVVGLYGFAAIQAALVHQMRHGKGSHVDVSMAEGMMSLVGTFFQSIQRSATYTGPLHPSYKTLDGYVAIPIVSPKTYRLAYKAIGRDDWYADPDYSSFDGIRRHKEEVYAEIARWTATRTSGEVDAHMTAADVPCAIHYMPHELFDHPQMQERGAFAEIDTGGGSFKVLNPPFRISGSPIGAQPFVAKLGADRTDVLSDLLGLDTAEIAALEKQKAFG